MSASAAIDTFGVDEPETPGLVTRRPLDLTAPADIVTLLMRAQMGGELVETYVAMLSDAQIPRVHEAILTELRQYSESFRVISAALVADAGKRMKERKARSLPDPEFEIELEDVYSDYTRNVDAAIEAAFLLPEDEANKVVKLVPLFVPDPVPAHHEVGNPLSIAALRRKYAGSKVDELLGRALSRVKVDTKVKMVRRKGAIIQGEVVS